MRLIFVYVSHRRVNKFIKQLPTEGYYWLIKRMVETGVVDEALIVFDAGSGPKEFKYETGIEGLILPDLSYLRRYVEVPNDVLWVRGGYRAWHNELKPIADSGTWTLCYAANTGRQRWLFWHVVLNDLQEGDWLDVRNRFQFHFRKPTHPKIFFPRDLPLKYDICVGASHIHDKKAQWKTIDGLIAYKRIYGKNLKAVLPGGMYHGVETNRILNKIAEHELNVDVVGMLPRPELAELLCRCKLFVHLGGHGQNDRGPLEANASGTPVMFETMKPHAPFLANWGVNFLASDANDPTALANDWFKTLPVLSEERRRRTAEYLEEQAGVETVILPRMRGLFSVFRRFPVADPGKLREEYAA